MARGRTIPHMGNVGAGERVRFAGETSAVRSLREDLLEAATGVRFGAELLEDYGEGLSSDERQMIYRELRDYADRVVALVRAVAGAGAEADEIDLRVDADVVVAAS